MVAAVFKIYSWCGTALAICCADFSSYPFLRARTCFPNTDCHAFIKLQIILVGLHSIRTGASTLHNYETLSGLRFAMYTSNDVGGADASSSSRRSSAAAESNVSVRNALQHIYTELWVESVIKSPLYRPGEMSTVGQSSSGSAGGGDAFDIRSTNFEKKLDAFLQSMPWFR